MKQAVAAWNGDMSFTARVGSGHQVVLDAARSVGGKDQGPRPTELILAAAGSCTGMDVVSILGKMRVPFDRFEVAVEGDQATEHPMLYTDLRVVYRLWGETVPAARYLRAVELSWTTYCSITALLRRAVRLSHRVELNGQVIREGPAETAAPGG